MAETRAYLRAFAAIESDPAAVLDRLNAELFADLEDTQFVTLILVRLDPKDCSLMYAGAGHGSGYLLSENGSLELELESTGVPLGYLRDRPYVNGRRGTLRPGSTLLLMTDGIAEAVNASENDFGDSRAVDFVARHRGRPAEEIIERLHQEVMDFTAPLPPADDITAVICRGV